MCEPYGATCAAHRQQEQTILSFHFSHSKVLLRKSSKTQFIQPTGRFSLITKTPHHTSDADAFSTCRCPQHLDLYPSKFGPVLGHRMSVRNLTLTTYSYSNRSATSVACHQAKLPYDSRPQVQSEASHTGSLSKIWLSIGPVRGRLVWSPLYQLTHGRHSSSSVQASILKRGGTR